MNYFKYFFRKTSLRRKILDIEDEIIKLVRPLCNERPFIYRLGGAEDADTFVDFWICVKTDNMANELESDIQLNNELWLVLEKYDYPLLYRDKVKIGFVSIETVKRESGGSLFGHLN